MIRNVTALLLVLGATLAAASTVRAVPAAQICRTFKLSGLDTAYFTIGNKWTCSSAKAWIVKLAADSVPPSNHNIPLKNGPGGYHCLAEPHTQNRAVAGTCFTGTIKFPGTGFAWLNR